MCKTRTVLIYGAQAGLDITLYRYIREVLGSNLGRDASYPDRFNGFHESLRENGDAAPRLRNTRCLHDPFPIHLSPSNPTLYSIYDRPDSSVGIAASYGLDDRRVRVRVPVGARFLSFPRRPGRLWSPTSFLANGYRG
jgi:hypothetical protein